MKNIKKDDFGKVAVLMGGWSAEREISLLSGQAVLTALQRQGVNAHAVDVGRNADQQLRQGNFDRVFNILHGTGGEDGVIQGMLEVLEIPYTGSSVKASAIAMDKLLTKRIWHAAGLATPDYLILNGSQDWQSVIDQLRLPLAVKPACEGSSIGVSKVECIEDLEPAYKVAAQFHGEVLVEQWIEGDEYHAAILQDKALPLVRVETARGFYDYTAKYESNDTTYHCPCGLDDVQEQALQSLAEEAFKTLGASGWGRVDLMRDQSGKAWLLELNTLPGMTSHSLVPKAAAVAGIDFDTLVLNILSTSRDAVQVDEKSAA